MAVEARLERRADGVMRALFPIGFGTALSLMGDATLYAVLPTHSAVAGIALASVGLMLSANRLIRLATNGPAGWLFDRISNRRLLFAASLWVGVLSTSLYAMAARLPWLLLARLLWGLAWSGIWVGGNGLVLQMAPENQRGRWVGVYQTWFFFGSALGSLLGGVLTDAAGYREGLWISTGISAIGAVVASFAAGDGSEELQRTKEHIHPSRFFTFKWNWPSPSMWAVAAAHGANRLVVAGVVSATLGLVIQQNIGSGLDWGAWQVGVASVTGGFLAGRTVVSLLGAPLVGAWSDRAGMRWEWLALSLFAGALGIGFLAVPNGIILVVGVIAGAAASGSIQSIATTLVGDLSTAEEHGKNLGMFFTAGDLGSAVGPLLAYWLLPIIGLDQIYIGCAILMAVVAATVAIIARSGK